MKLPLLKALTFLAATSSVLAERKLTYSCYNDKARNKGVGNERTSGPVVGDAFAEKIVKNMPTWSSHKYVATHDRFANVVVACSRHAESKDKALEALVDQGKIVREHILKEHE